MENISGEFEQIEGQFCGGTFLWDGLPKEIQEKISALTKEKRKQIMEALMDRMDDQIYRDIDEWMEDFGIDAASDLLNRDADEANRT